MKVRFDIPLVASLKDGVNTFEGLCGHTAYIVNRIDFTDKRNAFVVLEDREDEAFTVMFFDFYLYGRRVDIYGSGAINPNLHWSAPFVKTIGGEYEYDDECD